MPPAQSPPLTAAAAARLRHNCRRCCLDPPNHGVVFLDGHFVPNLTIGAPVVASLRKHSRAFFDCHLMVSEPSKWIQARTASWQPQQPLAADTCAALCSLCRYVLGSRCWRAALLCMCRCHLASPRPPQDFAAAGANLFTFHLEAVVPELLQLSQQEPHPAVAELCAAVRAAGMQAGIALKPSTPAELVLPYVKQGLLDLVRPPHALTP